jgi:hypothetical protein
MNGVLVEQSVVEESVKLSDKFYSIVHVVVLKYHH